MTPELISPEQAEGGRPRLADELADGLLEREVRDFMTPGCVAISEDATVADAAEVLARHRVHAVLVVGANNGTPLGWVTARGLLGWLGRDRSLVSAREGITERDRHFPERAGARRALRALALWDHTIARPSKATPAAGGRHHRLRPGHRGEAMTQAP
jgi:CBS domain-containing protein